MLADMPIHILREWMAFFDLEPWGHPIADRRHVDLCVMQGATRADRRTIAKTIAHKPNYAAKKRPDTASEIIAKLTAAGWMKP